MNDVEIHLEPMTVEHGELRVPYVITNRSSEPVFVANLVPDRFGQLAGKPDLTPTARLAQTCHDHDGVVLFVLAEVRRPRRFPEPSYLAPAGPKSSRIDAGASLRATIRARLPLVEWSEIWIPQPEAPELVRHAVTLVQVVAEIVRAANVVTADEDADHRGCFAVVGQARERILADRDVTGMGLTIAAHPRAPRFA